MDTHLKFNQINVSWLPRREVQSTEVSDTNSLYYLHSSEKKNSDDDDDVGLRNVG